MENNKGTKKNNLKNYQPHNPNLFSSLWLCWVCPVLFKGNKRDIEEDDLITPSNHYAAEKQGEKLERYWFNELENAARENRKPSLWTAMRKCYWLSFMPAALLIAVQNGARTVQPLLFSQLLSYWSVDSSMTRKEAGLYALIMLSFNFFGMLCQHHNTLFVSRFSMKIKVASTAILFRKLMRMSQASVGEVAAGKLVNLMSNDIARFDYAFMFLHHLWIIPIQVAVVLYLLWNSAGYAPFVGLFSVVILILPIQASLTKLTSAVRRETAVKTDRRIKLMTEIVNGIQVIKMYAWEIPFQAVVRAARKFEMKSVTKAIFIRSLFVGFMLFTERTILLVTALTIVLSGSVVTATTMYPIQQFLSIIQMNLTMIIPLAVASLSEMMVSLERIQEVLLLGERDDLTKYLGNQDNGNIGANLKFNSKSSKEPNYILPKKYSTKKDSTGVLETVNNRISEYAVEISNVNASWTDAADSKESTLKNISLRVRKGKLCAVIGPVGSGKSSLLQLILKELPTSSGNINLNGEISYACQESWLFPATVRENILFGLPYDVRKYNEVCKVCCLLPDFKQFPYGDLSLVGERGVSLSGGQRARINLARAVYREADIYLLDDPLSAVDANVGRLLFDGCIKGYLRSRTVILVTHQIHFLKDADLLVVLNEGAIDNMGTYDDVQKSDNAFTNMLAKLEEPDETQEGDGKKRPSMQRGVSRVSVKSGAEETKDEKEQMQAEEERSKGTLKWAVVAQYLRSVNSWCIVTAAFLVLALCQSAGTATDYWLSFWTNQVDAYEQSLLQDEEADPGLDTQMGVLKTWQYLTIYGSLVLAVIILAQARIIAFVWMTMKASENIHDNIFQNLIRAVMRFFDTNPSGRILNRFSKDMGAMDELLPRSMLETIQMYLTMISILVLNAIALPWTLVPTAVLVVVFLIVLKWYLNAAQAVKRLEGTTKSPVFGMISSSVSGLSTIRSSQSQDRLLTQFDNVQDLHSRAFYTFVGAQTAFSLYLDMICLLYIGTIITIFLFLDFDGTLAVGSVGMAVSQSMILTMMLQMAARFTADFLSQMTSVERVLEYTKLPSEDNIDSGTIEPSKTWPSKGQVEFENVFLKYGMDDPPVLKNLNFQFQSGWKIGVVGRTGAGKSSLIAALFRLTNIEGSIKVDNVDTKDVGKQLMRSKISIIPQEPVLFSATIRYNLDPFDYYSDDEIWRALEQVELKEAIPALDYKVAEGGSNFSVGQRQLMCLARAVLRSNKILVMDEATANVDPQTDALIQKTIRSTFESCTVITIAHRLNTIMDSDRVLVMDNGEAVELDHPYTLLSNPNSKFSFMVKETGESMAKTLFDIAKAKYSNDDPL